MLAQQFISYLKKNGPDKIYKQGQEIGYGRELGTMSDMTTEIWKQIYGALQKDAHKKKRPPAEMKAMETLNQYVVKTVLGGKLEDLEFQDKTSTKDFYAQRESLFTEGKEFALKESNKNFLNKLVN